jgi:hypothetical protein
MGAKPKVAFLLLVHKAPDQVTRLKKALSPYPLLVHADVRADEGVPEGLHDYLPRPVHRMAEFLGENLGVCFVPHHEIPVRLIETMMAAYPGRANALVLDLVDQQLLRRQVTRTS